MKATLLGCGWVQGKSKVAAARRAALLPLH
jgi:hypothetical protein